MGQKEIQYDTEAMKRCSRAHPFTGYQDQNTGESKIGQHQELMRILGIDKTITEDDEQPVKSIGQVCLTAIQGDSFYLANPLTRVCFRTDFSDENPTEFPVFEGKFVLPVCAEFKCNLCSKSSKT
jgi:hypothetical protein